MRSISPLTAPAVNNSHGFADEVPSPCVNICAIDPARGVCVGCFRTLDEIASWVEFDAPQRVAVWDAIAERKKAADAHR